MWIEAFTLTPSDRKVAVWILLFLAVLAAIVAVSVERGNRKRDAWVSECVKDGNKRYSCEERYDTAHRVVRGSN